MKAAGFLMKDRFDRYHVFPGFHVKRQEKPRRFLTFIEMKRHPIWDHVIGWTGLYLVWTLLFRDHALTVTRTLTVQFCYLFFIAANYYLQIYIGIPFLLYRKKYLAFALVLPAGVALTALLRVPLSLFLQRHVFRTGLPAPSFGNLFRDSFLNIFVWVACIIAIRLVFEKIRFRQYLDTIEKEKAKNELDFLKAQFNPHFLFNSINSIYGHIDRKNSTARNMLLSFSEMLRYQLYECNVDYIPIDKEIHYIRNYITLQQVRKEEDLQICLDIAENIKGFTIAPLLFIAFIENAFKYVSYNGAGENKVEISLRKKDDWLIFRSFNTRDRSVNGPGMDCGGIGIANVKRRLELQYPQQYELLTRKEDESYEITLNLKIG
ncbi:MAG TPA: histidine kinase [Puia sp.]|nr:histidine kinase [Puia sp.]